MMPEMIGTAVITNNTSKLRCSPTEDNVDIISTLTRTNEDTSEDGGAINDNIEGKKDTVLSDEDIEVTTKEKDKLVTAEEHEDNCIEWDDKEDPYIHIPSRLRYSLEGKV